MHGTRATFSADERGGAGLRRRTHGHKPNIADDWRRAATALTAFWGALVLLLVWLAQPAYVRFGPSTEARTAAGQIAALSHRFDCWGNDGKPHPYPGGVLVQHQGRISHGGSVREVDRLLRHLQDPHLIGFCRR